jgi:hypothetical protein
MKDLQALTTRPSVVGDTGDYAFESSDEDEDVSNQIKDDPSKKKEQKLTTEDFFSDTHTNSTALASRLQESKGKYITLQDQCSAIDKKYV